MKTFACTLFIFFAAPALAAEATCTRNDGQVADLTVLDGPVLKPVVIIDHGLMAYVFDLGTAMPLKTITEFVKNQYSGDGKKTILGTQLLTADRLLLDGKGNGALFLKELKDGKTVAEYSYVCSKRQR